MVQRKETRSSLNLFSVSRRNVMTSNRHIRAPAAAAGGAGAGGGGGGGGGEGGAGGRGGGGPPFCSSVWSGVSTPTIRQNLRPQGAPRRRGAPREERGSVVGRHLFTPGGSASSSTCPVVLVFTTALGWRGVCAGQTVFRFLRFLTFQLLQNTVHAKERLILCWTATWSIPQIIHTHFVFRVTFSHRTTPILT